jgi:integrase
MRWCEDIGYRPEQSNPCRGTKKYTVSKRERFLSAEELRRLGDVLAQVEKDSGASLFAVAAIRLLILTGARLNEILTLKWSYVDLHRGLILLPDSKTGKKSIRLNEPAIKVLTRLPRLRGNPHVIVGQVDGGHVVNLQKTWRHIRALAGLDDVRIHDLRHSFASVAAASGASLPMIGKLLGHTQPKTTARYAHLADDPLHQLKRKVGNAIVEAMNGPRNLPLRRFLRVRPLPQRRSVPSAIRAQP